MKPNEGGVINNNGPKYPNNHAISKKSLKLPYFNHLSSNFNANLELLSKITGLS